MSDSRRTLKALHQLALAHVGPASAALKTREALEAALETALAKAAAPVPPPIRGFEVRAPMVVKAPFRPLEAPVLPGPFGDDQVLVFPRDAASVLVSWDLSRRAPAVLQVRDDGAVLRRIEGLSPMGTLQLDGLGEAHTITIELIQATRTVGRSKPLTLPGRSVRRRESPAVAPAQIASGLPNAGGELPTSQGGVTAQRANAASLQPERRAPSVTAAASPGGVTAPGSESGRGGKVEPASRQGGQNAAESASSRSAHISGEPSSSRSSQGPSEPSSSRSAHRSGEPSSSRSSQGPSEPSSSRSAHRSSEPSSSRVSQSAAEPSSSRTGPRSIEAARSSSVVPSSKPG